MSSPITSPITDVATKKFLGGERPEFTIEIRDAAGVLTNPTTISVIVRDPTSVETSYTGGSIVNQSTGIYLFTYPSALANLPGEWHIKVVSTGTVTAHIGRFEVATSPFTT